MGVSLKNFKYLQKILGPSFKSASFLCPSPPLKNKSTAHNSYQSMNLLNMSGLTLSTFHVLSSILLIFSYGF